MALGFEGMKGQEEQLSLGMAGGQKGPLEGVVTVAIEATPPPKKCHAKS